MLRRQPQKIFIDSRFANADGSFDLPNNGITCHPDSTCWLTEFSTVASWWTVDESNEILYIRERLVSVVDGQQVVNWNNRKVVLSLGAYDLDTLADEIAFRLNGPGKDPSMGTYSCTRVSGSIGGGGTGATQRCYAITSSGGQFQIPSEARIRDRFNIPSLQLTRSTNYLFSFPTNGDTNSSSHTSALVDLRRAHNLYIHTPGFGAYTCLGPRGSSNIIAKIAVDAGYGQPLYYNFVASELEGVKVGVHAVNRIKLELRDVFGSLVDLRGGHWSATLVFQA